MPTAQEVEEQLKRLDGFGRAFTQREIKVLPSILWEGEEIRDGIQGSIDAKLGLLVATDRRLIFVEKGMLGRLKVEDFPYDKITSIQYETGWVLGKITIYASGNRSEIANISKESVQAFAESVRSRISGGASSVPAPKTELASAPAITSPSDDALAKLERLAALKASGALTEEEFASAKSRLLAAL